MSTTKKRRLMEEKQQFFEVVDQKIDFINSLDHYSLEQIFLWLPICDRMNLKKVCTRWKEICKRAWYDIKKYKCSHSIGGAYNNQLLTQSYVKKLLLTCGIGLQEIILSNVCTSKIMPIIGKHCRNITRLEFVIDDRLPFNKNDYFYTFTMLDKMKIIKIHLITKEFGGLTFSDFEAFDSLPEGINEIHITHEKNKKMDEKYFYINLKKFKNLHSLTLSRCAIDRMIWQISETITLVYLNLEDSWVYTTRPLSEDIFNKLVNLKHICLCDNFIDCMPTLVTTILKTCKSIRYFKCLPGPFYDDPLASIENWENLKSLKYITLEWDLKYDSAVKIVKYCNDLEGLSFHYRITEDTLLKLTELKNLKRLKFGIGRVSDDSVRTISNSCRKLKYLEISYMKRSSPFDTEDVYRYWHTNDNNDDDDDDNEPVLHATIFNELSKLERLEYLDVSGVHKFTDSSIIAVASKCKSLKCLNISHCKYITGAGLNAITSLEFLQKLNVTSLKSVTDSFIIKLKGLNLLKANKCKNITDSGIIQLIRNCPDLENLRLSGTKMTIDTIVAADQETEYRKNDIILYIHFYSQTIEPSCRPIIKSKWLVINYQK